MTIDEPYEDIVKDALSTYSRAIESGTSVHERVLWGDMSRQYHRFKEITELVGDISRAPVSILDVGCGNGEYYKYLNFNGFIGEYSGVDIHPQMISEATARFPDVTFAVANPFAAPLPQADFVTLSGVFNVDNGQGQDYVRSLIGAAYRSCRFGVVFNAISTHVNDRHQGTYYLDPADAIAIAAKLSSRFVVRHGFVPYNYTVAIFRHGNWRSVA